MACKADTELEPKTNTNTVQIFSGLQLTGIQDEATADNSNFSTSAFHSSQLVAPHGSFSSQGTGNRHVLPRITIGGGATNRTQQCPRCGKTLSTCPGTLQRHIRTVHLGLKPFTCELCGRKFSRKDNMLTHQQGTHCQGTSKCQSMK